MIIFLDIDGVLNCNQRYAVYNYPRIFPEHVELFERIVKACPEVKIVLVTNWKGIIGKDATAQYLAKAGITAPVVDATPFGPTRGDEVHNWLVAHDALTTPYVILDDRTDYAEDQPWVRTSDAIGLTAEQVETAIQLLKGGV
jgi:hypothetical protein